MNRVLRLVVAGIASRNGRSSYQPEAQASGDRLRFGLVSHDPRLRFGLVSALVLAAAAGTMYPWSAAGAEPPATKPASKSDAEFLEIRCRGADEFDDVSCSTPARPNRPNKTRPIAWP